MKGINRGSRLKESAGTVVRTRELARNGVVDDGYLRHEIVQVPADRLPEGQVRELAQGALQVAGVDIDGSRRSKVESRQQNQIAVCKVDVCQAML